MLEILKKSLLQAKYQIAEEICECMEINKIRDIIITIAFDTESICVYCFTQYMIRKKREVFWIELAIDIMIHPLCHIEGAYSVALFHAREVLSIEKSIGNLERILFFYNIPEKLVDEQEAKIIAKEILKIEPNNQVALAV